MQFGYRKWIFCVRNIEGNIAPQHTVTKLSSYFTKYVHYMYIKFSKNNTKFNIFNHDIVILKSLDVDEAMNWYAESHGAT